LFEQNTALVALQKLILKQGDGSSHQCIITNQPIVVAFMRKNKNAVFRYSYVVGLLSSRDYSVCNQK